MTEKIRQIIFLTQKKSAPQSAPDTACAMRALSCQ
jgi:hypothetical protein